MGSFRSPVKLTFEISNLFNLTSALNCYVYADISKERKNSGWTISSEYKTTFLSLEDVFLLTYVINSFKGSLQFEVKHT